MDETGTLAAAHMQRAKDVVSAFLLQSNFIEGVYDSISFHQAMQAWKSLPTIQFLTGVDVRQAHAILMLNHLPQKDRGRYRTVPVYVAGREGKNAILIPGAMESWLDAMNMSVENETDIESLERRARGLHVEYEKIHPFIDGNGRTGRMFMNWWRLRAGLPILILWESEKQEYYKWFQ